MPDTPRSMEQVAELMRENLPRSMSPAEFGQKMKWGRGSDEARQRIHTLTIEDLDEIGLTVKQATNWAIAYEAVCRLMPTNPSAEGRAVLLRHAAQMLSGK